MSWEFGVADIIRVISFSIIAFSLSRLFSGRATAILGWCRWFLSFMVSTIAVLELASFTAGVAGLRTLHGYIRLFDSLCLFGVAVSLWPFLDHVRRRVTAASDKRLKNRLDLAEAQAIEARRWLLMAEEISHVGHWRVGIPGNDLFWSDEVFRIFGLSKTTYKPEIRSATKAFHPDDQQMFRTLLARAFETQSSFEFEIRAVRPDGEIRYVLSRGFVQAEGLDGRLSVFGAFLDLTAQKQAEAKLVRAKVLAEQANHTLRELALVDSLTGLPNRRRFDGALEAEFKRAARDRTAIGLIMIDVDHFKGFNDIHGHPAGDECLRLIADAIAGVPQRPGDLTARYGGEEIVVLLPCTGQSATRKIAEAIAAAVATLQISHPGSPSGIVTVSCGAAAWQPNAGQALPNLLQHADQALYQAKTTGRNRVASYQPVLAVS